MKRLVVIGGGIAGVAAASGAAMRRHFVPGGLEVTLLERADAVGGKARSERDGEWLLESGPNGFLSGETAMDRLIEQARFEDQLVPAREDAAIRYIYHGGKVRRVSPNPKELLSEGLLSPLGLMRALCDRWIPGRRSYEDETIWSFAKRRFGAQVADNLVAPMVRGIYAGDARQISFMASFPNVEKIERRYGSILRGIADRKSKSGQTQPTGFEGKLQSFRDGLQSLPEALVERGEFDVRLGVDVTRCEADKRGGWIVHIDGESEPIECNALLLTGEPGGMAGLIREKAPEVADILADIATPPLSVVTLGFADPGAHQVPPGYGVLVSAKEGLKTIGCLFESQIWPDRAPAGGLLVRSMIGGAQDPASAALPDDQLIAVAREELGRLFGLTAEPTVTRVSKWPLAIPQYTPGHLKRMHDLELLLDKQRGLFLAGNALHGVAFTKAAASGLAAGERACRKLAGMGAR